MPDWLEPEDTLVSAELERAIGGHPLVARILTRRGIHDPLAARAFLDPSYYEPANPEALPGMAAAVARLEQALRNQETIAVWGDFDVDGQTATALLVEALQALGGDVRYHVPVRAEESHGVNVPNLKRLFDAGAGLVLTCDTGVAAHQALEYARSRGVDVVVTDHHTPPQHLPPAVAVVNPRLLADPDRSPLGSLPGVGVAFKLAEALFRRAGRSGEADKWLDLVALGIVADLTVLRGETRYLLQRGLDTLRRTHRPGLQAVFEAAEIVPENLTEEHIGFQIGPRLNALGRLADANAAVELLTTRSLSRARLLAQQLEGYNKQRQFLTNQVFEAAQAQLRADPSLLSAPALVLSHPSWPAGVIGIVASRLVERYGKPVVLIAAPPGEPARGSARSVAGLNITEAIAAQREYLTGYGGHAMAAGLSLDRDRIADFRAGFVRSVGERTGGEIFRAALQVEAYFSLAELDLDLVDDLERLAPFGPGNPPVVLASRNLRAVNQASIGRDGTHRQVTVEDEAGNMQRVLWWDSAELPLPAGRFDLAYTARASSFGGQRQVQLTWLDSRTMEGEPGEEIRAPQYEISDYRLLEYLDPVLEELCSQEGVVVWSEAASRNQAAGRARHDLYPADTLVIWTIPPGRAELAAALEAVSPRRVALFGSDPQVDRLPAFLERLAGLVKYALAHSGGEIVLERLAAAMAHRRETARAGLEWLAASGAIGLVWQDSGDVRVTAAGEENQPALPSIRAGLESLLSETAAFRSYYRRADAEHLLQTEKSAEGEAAVPRGTGR